MEEIDETTSEASEEATPSEGTASNPSEAEATTEPSSSAPADAQGSRPRLEVPVPPGQAGVRSPPSPPRRPRRRAALEKDPLLGAKKPFKPEAKPRINPLNSVPEYAATRPIQDLLPDLARTFNIHFLSDAYFSSREFVSVASLRREALAPRDVLQHVAGDLLPLLRR